MHTNTHAIDTHAIGTHAHASKHTAVNAYHIPLAAAFITLVHKIDVQT